MGQYYKPISLKKNWKLAKNPIREFLRSYDFNCGSKLMEHSYIGVGYMRVVEELLHDKFSCYPFVWCGDYADDMNTKFNHDKSLFYLTDDLNLKPLQYTLDEDNCFKCAYRYIINDSKKEFIDLSIFYTEAEQNTDEMIIHPLPILCSDGNGRGGGDYNGTNMDFVGRWAYDKIYTDNNVPNGYKKLNISFKETR